MANLNLLVAWVWVGLGFLSGMVMGVWFNREQWLGGYGSWKRRLYRLGHISFFGLGMVNLMFYFTAAVFRSGDWVAVVASMGFVVGAFTMPLCCLIMAHFPKAKMIFAVPVVSLLIAGGFTIAGIIKTDPPVLKAAAALPHSRRFASPQDPAESETNAAARSESASYLGKN